MMPIEFPNFLEVMNINNGNLLGLAMQLSFFVVLLFTTVSLFISFLHLVWYGTSAFRSYVSLVVFVLISAPVFLFAYKIMPQVVFKLSL